MVFALASFSDVAIGPSLGAPPSRRQQDKSYQSFPAQTQGAEYGQNKARGYGYPLAGETPNAIYFLMNIISFAPPGLLCILYRNPGLAMLARGCFLTRLRR